MIDLGDAATWTLLKDRGWIASFIRPPKDVHDPVQLMGQVVRIDGHDHLVKGVETFAITRDDEHPYQLPFSILAEDGYIKS
jgi:hypothetical protein